MGRVVSFNGQSEQSIWSDAVCNRIHGTDATILPPNIRRDEGVCAFEPMLCRSFCAKYERNSKVRGIPVQRFTLDMGDIKVRTG